MLASSQVFHANLKPGLAPFYIAWPRGFKRRPGCGELFQLREERFSLVATESNECRPYIAQAIAIGGSGVCGSFDLIRAIRTSIQ